MNFDIFKEQNFDAPFKSNGEPQKYLRLLVPFFEKDTATKYDMLRLMGVDIKADPSKRNTHSTTLAKLSKAKILEVKAQGNGYWRKGANWNLFMAWITFEMLNNPKMKNKFKDLLVRYDTNALDFILKD